MQEVRRLYDWTGGLETEREVGRLGGRLGSETGRAVWSMGCGRLTVREVARFGVGRVTGRGEVGRGEGD